LGGLVPKIPCVRLGRANPKKVISEGGSVPSAFGVAFEKPSTPSMCDTRVLIVERFDGDGMRRQKM